MSNPKDSFSVQGFYGSKTKRKWIGIERSVNEVVKKHKEERVPTPFPSRILGPSTNWRTFFRQKDAFDYSRSKAKDLHVFAFESSTYDGNSGQRMYLVTSYAVFWHYYSQMLEDRRHHYEVIPEGAVCKLYFDLEYNILLNPNSDGNKMVELLIQYVCLALELEFGVKCTRQDVLDLDASTEEKFSRHLIFQLKRAVFKDNIHEGRFVCYMMSQVMQFLQTGLIDDTLNTTSDITQPITHDRDCAMVNKESHTKQGQNQETIESVKCQSKDKRCEDTSSLLLETMEVYRNHTHDQSTQDSICQSDSLSSVTKPSDRNSTVTSHQCETNTARLPETKYSTAILDERYRNVLQNFTTEDLQSFVVKNKNGEDGLFCDLGVYTKNRNFRLYMSSKLNKKNPLVLSTENQCLISDKQEDLFLQSLISNIKFSASTQILTFEKECDGVGFPRSRTERVEGKVSIEGYSKSPYPEADEHIAALIMENGNQGSIRHWTYFHQGELLLYEISRYRFCHNIGRQHRSNNIMFIVDLHRGVFYQKCHDPDCYAQNYKSPEWQLPHDVLPASYFTDIEDEFELETDDQELLDSTLELEQQIQNKSTDADDLNDGDDEDLINAAEVMDTSHSTSSIGQSL